ncbi:MAG: hypothetical protein QOG85_2106 [Gaiellaceae bacterium]|jgi:predicted membrane channel-forming protein YqfA (hemolysin III family)|nr:hypothetical protein [Gaiellaceae bacterium]
MQAIAARKAHLVGCGWFWAWAVVGVGLGFGISVIGIFTIPAALLAAVVMSRRQPVRGAFGIATGIGSVLLFVAYQNRQGPGTTCHSLPMGGQECGEHLNPLPWVVLGVILFAAGVVLHARQTD